MNWQQKLNEDENSELKIRHGHTLIYATLETSARNFPVHYHGEGTTVAEALAELDRDLEREDQCTS